MDYWVLPRRARDRGKKLRHLQRISEESDILCLQEAPGRIEHLAHIDMVLDRAILFKFGTFTLGHVTAGGSVIFAGFDIFGTGTAVEHEVVFPGRDHLFRIRFHDCRDNTSALPLRSFRRCVGGGDVCGSDD